MTVSTIQEFIPLVQDADGIMRVGATRVTLDSLVYAFEQGATPEEIVQQYPSLKLADVYSVIGYYLNHRDEVKSYLSRQDALAEETRKQYPIVVDMTEIRERLLARLKD